MYTPFGEVSWESRLAQTDFGFTGQRREGFGLMDYNARFYSASLGRFVSADTVVPGAGNPLAFDRYSYVLGNPINDNDPSGHGPGMGPDKTCADGIRCTVYTTPQPPRTHSGDPIPGYPNQTRGIGGEEVYQLFQDYQDTCGWWNNGCTTHFGLTEFLGMWIFFEGGHLEEMAEVLATVLAQNFFVGGNNGPICSTSQSCLNNANAIFNFMGAYSLGGGGLFDGPNELAIINADINHIVEGGMSSYTASLGAKALNPPSVESWDRDTGPSNWGNIKGGLPDGDLDRLGITSGFHTLDKGTVYYRNGTFVVYSKMQRDSLPDVDWRLTTDPD